jgi:hypothetical protein
VLRALLLVLVLANVLWWGWSRGHLPAGLLPWPRDDVQREPQRLAQQVHPERVQVLPAGPLPPPATACLQAGPMTAGQAGETEFALAAAGFPDGSWERTEDADGVRLRVPAADAAQQAALAALAASAGRDAAEAVPSDAPAPALFSACD